MTKKQTNEAVTIYPHHDREEKIVDGKLTAWALGGKVPKNLNEAEVHFWEYPQLLPRTFNNSLAMLGFNRLIIKENEYRKTILPVLNQFLAELASNYAMVTRACRATGLTLYDAKRLRALIPSFDLLWHEQNELAADAIETVAIERAIHGVPASEDRKYSDSLLVLILKARRPLLYGAEPERPTQVAGLTYNDKVAWVQSDKAWRENDQDIEYGADLQSPHQVTLRTLKDELAWQPELQHLFDE